MSGGKEGRKEGREGLNHVQIQASVDQTSASTWPCLEVSSAVLKKSLVDVRRSIDFERWTVFFADERFVPADHEDSNFRANAGWLKEAGVPKDQIFAVNTSLPTPKEAAEAYESLIRQQVPKGFDLVLLGMVADGTLVPCFPNTHS